MARGVTFHPGQLYARGGGTATGSSSYTAPATLSTHSLRLDGSSQYCYADDSARLSLTGDITTELWVRYQSLPASGLRMVFPGKWLQTGSNNRSWTPFLFNDAGTYLVKWYMNDTGGAAANSGVRWPWTPVVGVWYHVAITNDISNAQATEATLYINGVSQGNPPVIEAVRNISAMFDSAARYEVGSWDHNGFVADPGLLHADICHVRLWSTVRTETEIQQHMTVLLDGDETGLIEDWRFGNALTSNASGGTTLTAVGSPSFITDVPF